MNNPSIQEICYIAGFFDGEGCIQINMRTSGSCYCYVTMAQKYVLEPLYICEKYWGGSLREQKCGTMVWHCSTRKAEKFLKDIYPYLIVKKSQAEVVFDFYKLILPSNSGSNRPSNDNKTQRIVLRDRLKSLKKKYVK